MSADCAPAIDHRSTQLIMSASLEARQAAGRAAIGQQRDAGGLLGKVDHLAEPRSSMQLYGITAGDPRQRSS
jgi:hypothetical protein